MNGIDRIKKEKVDTEICEHILYVMITDKHKDTEGVLEKLIKEYKKNSMSCQEAMDFVLEGLVGMNLENICNEVADSVIYD